MREEKNLYFAKTHEWVDLATEGKAVIGLSKYAADKLGDIAFVNLPAEGDSVTAGETMGDIESIKSVSDIYAPVSGTVCAVNEDIDSAPEKVNEEPYEAWFIEVEGELDKSGLMDYDAYRTYISGLDED